MSDPAKTPEIEDVLASIRRLVSVDSQPDGDSGRRSQRAPTSKLVLTSDQRVGPVAHNTEKASASQPKPYAENGKEQPGSAHDAWQAGTARNPGSDGRPSPNGSEIVAPVVTSERLARKPANGESPIFRSGTNKAVQRQQGASPSTLEERIAQLESAVSSGADFEPDGSEDQAQHVPTSVPKHRTRGAQDGPDGRTTLERLVQDATREALTGSSDISQFKSRQPATATHASSDRMESGPDSDTPPLELIPDNRTEGSQDAAPRGEGTTGFRHQRMAPRLHLGTPDTGRFSVPVDEFHFGPPEKEDLPEADDAETADTDAEEEAQASTRETDAPGIREDAGHEPEEPQPNAFNTDELSEDGVLDEAALRDLVAEIVREELQGALGERITRNVRKLVRREIMRAITVRNFE
ncbi:hypothetical protein [Palleronia pelagia]|uniref:Uncharacterized protein n=1 Tax=Palleronia pelagia TaxID=387096 RepID=A0A1H8B753_9RHOB|nr:hypothetical protein [Palleronia pelagia]SEM78692.1 hypothetical protein SAMN04488011_101466 [Palleronia pelagia]